MAGTIPLSMTQQLDEFGAPLAGGFLYIIQAGTVATPQIAYQDSGLTIPVPGGSRITLDASGRISQFFLADGSIKIRLTDKNGVTKIVADGLIVTGASSGGGGGSPVDPTTVLQTGWVQPIYGTGVIAGFVRLNARTVGNATSGATERANADTAALFAFLYNADPNLAVSGGRGASAAADYAANKTIALPDFRNRVPAGLGDMGNSDAGLFTAGYFPAGGTTLGGKGGAEKSTLTTVNLPPYTPAGSFVGTTPNTKPILWSTATIQSAQGGGTVASPGPAGDGSVHLETSLAVTGTFTGTAQGGTSEPVRTIPPTILLTYYIKL